jgi:hypothetical protein
MFLKRLQLSKSDHLKCQDGWDNGINDLIANVKYMRINLSLFKSLLLHKLTLNILRRAWSSVKICEIYEFLTPVLNTDVVWDIRPCQQTVTDESKDESAFFFRHIQTERETDGH